ncbi:DUF1667 domain-containing protein [Vallitalea okinawensis]|uniref:DUF1667 domain-containing protein n=1 Tax=Vallitalea okinawensis TaxID=2078660 RepID=UPI000CFAAF7B|nr:DUF1667 domain-containing protein [Vallitalea okinawensis]
MQEVREMVCIVCPVGCHMKVTSNEGQVTKVEGNSCKRGIGYAEAECTHPTRTLTTTMRIKNGEVPMISVKTDEPVPKSLLMACMEAINKAKIQAPIHVGDKIIENILDTGSNIVATRNCERKA